MAQKTAKQRLDVLLVERGLTDSREMARRLIMAGEVTVNDQLVDKPGTQVNVESTVALKSTPRFVSRGGDKLEAALSAFAIDVEGKICADVGASTGGFTDCLLQHGAAKVYAIDVGYGQLDYRLRQNPHVINMERTNARYVDTLPEAIAIASVDASFISLKLLLPVIKNWLTDDASVICLIKPQFEAGKQDVGKGGVVKSTDVHRRVLMDVLNAAQGFGYAIAGLILSPLKGPAGNIEFLTWLQVGMQANAPIDALIETVLPHRDGKVTTE